MSWDDKKNRITRQIEFLENEIQQLGVLNTNDEVRELLQAVLDLIRNIYLED